MPTLVFLPPVLAPVRSCRRRQRTKTLRPRSRKPSARHATAEPSATRWEPPVTPEELKRRVDLEAQFLGGEDIGATIVAQGRLREPGKLPKVSETICVKSRTLALDLALGIESLSFTQDRNGGTRTTFGPTRPGKMGALAGLRDVTLSDTVGSAAAGQAQPARIDPPDRQTMERSGRGVAINPDTGGEAHDRGRGLWAGALR